MTVIFNLCSNVYYLQCTLVYIYNCHGNILQYRNPKQCSENEGKASISIESADMSYSIAFLLQLKAIRQLLSQPFFQCPEYCLKNLENVIFHRTRVHVEFQSSENKSVREAL